MTSSSKYRGIIGGAILGILGLCFAPNLNVNAQERDTINVSTFQPPPDFHGFFSQFLDEFSGQQTSNDWHSFLDGDVWVFFMKDRADIQILPEFARDLLESLELDGERFARAEIISFETGREVTVVYFFADRLDDVSELSCRAGAIAAGYSAKAPQKQIVDAIEICTDVS
jgi:hypothetical protein